MRHSHATRSFHVSINNEQAHDEHAHVFWEGHRVIAPARPGFPAGTIVKVLTHGYLLVRWDGNVLEKAHHHELSTEDFAGL